MHDIAFIRANPAAFDAALARRGLEPQADRIVALDAKKREAATRVQQAQSRRNEASKAIGQAMGQGDEEKAEALKAEVAEIKASMPEWEEAENAAGEELKDLLAILPNLPAEDVPEGADEADNVELHSWGTKRDFAFAPKEHADIGPALGMDFETGAKLSGARFTFLRGDIARMHRALAQFMLDKQTRENGYTECNPPVLVGDDAMYGTDKLPKFAEDSFRTTDDRWLVPTSEVPLTYSVAGDILADLAQPIRLTAHTLCFRSEAGSAGRDTRGFIRQHQFEKVELVRFVRPGDSDAALELLTGHAEAVLKRLELPYRKVLLCGGDMGFSARKTYDLEVWLPGQSAYREISSCSNFGDFQARRMQARWRNPETGKPELLHTLNGSGLAVGRTLVAILENGQQADGSVRLPEALHPYLGGRAVLGA